MVWSEDAIETVRQLASDGKSAAYAAQALAAREPCGARISRSAVLSVAKRRGIKFRSRGPAPPIVKPLMRYPNASNIVRKSAHSRPLPVPAASIGEMLLLDIGELTSASCRWPAADATEDEPMRFCGRARPEGESYCREHHALAYAPRKAA